MKIKILSFAGSLRKDSFNKQLVKIAVRGAEKAGAQVTYIDLKDYPLPIYDADLEAQAFPEEAKYLKKLFLEHQGLLISTPEYNSGIPPVLKNVIDWVSRPIANDEPFLSCYQKKVAILMSASVGYLGGRRALYQLRDILQNIQCIVLPETYHAANAAKGLGDEASIESLGTTLAEFLKQQA